MNGLDRLLACRGVWEGRNRVQVDRGATADESATRIVVTPVLNGLFVRLDQTWAWQGTPQHGSILIGHDPTSGQADLHWIDTWHNGRRAMPLVGQFDADGTLVAHGTFPTADGPDWGWRIEIRTGDVRLKLDMFCVNPTTGEDDGGAWADLARA